MGILFDHFELSWGGHDSILKITVEFRVNKKSCFLKAPARPYLSSINYMLKVLGEYMVYFTNSICKCWITWDFFLLSFFLYTLFLINNEILMYTYSFKCKDWFIFTCQRWRVEFITTLQSEMGPYPSILIPDGNVTLVTLFACLLTILYLRDRQRRMTAQVVHLPQIDNNW